MYLSYLFLKIRWFSLSKIVINKVSPFPVYAAEARHLTINYFEPAFLLLFNIEVTFPLCRYISTVFVTMRRRRGIVDA